MGELKHPVRDKNIVDTGFRIMVILKGISALAELLVGIFLALPFSRVLQKEIIEFLKEELVEKSDDKIINMLYSFFTGYTMDMNNFMITYMVFHGLIKLIIVYLLYKNKIWAYPFSVAVLILFVIYQMYKFMTLHSVLLIILTVLDIVLIVFTILEYRKVKSNGQKL